ncbi:hypothetical protein D018_3886B, partial [Vibrio parahaemolyticus VP2007-007]
IGIINRYTRDPAFSLFL